MRILQVIDQLNVGGAERVLVDLSNILFEHGHNVNVLVLVRPGPLAGQLMAGIDLINLDRKMKFDPIKLRQVNRVCRNFDLVHVHLRYNFRYLALAKLLFGGSYQLLLHDHFGDIENDQSIPVAIRYFARRNKWFAGVSQPLVHWAEDKLGLAPENVLLLPNIVVKKVGLAERRLRPMKAVRILHVSNFREAKNHAFAIKVIAALRAHIPIRVCFVGQIVDPKFFEGIIEMMEESKIRDIVTVRHDCDEVQSLMPDYDLGLHTAFQESGPLVLAEYLAQKLPFVAYKTGEVSGQISAVLPEFFMTNFEIQKWTDRILTILAERSEFIGRMGTVFEERYSTKRYYDMCTNFYHQILNYGARPTGA